MEKLCDVQVTGADLNKSREDVLGRFVEPALIAVLGSIRPQGQGGLSEDVEEGKKYILTVGIKEI